MITKLGLNDMFVRKGKSRTWPFRERVTTDKIKIKSVAVGKKIVIRNVLDYYMLTFKLLPSLTLQGCWQDYNKL